jgi:3-oxoacyl-[acyl-carrier protein] reductase
MEPSMTKTLEGKSALVTGASSGIGTATALILAREGADVAFTYRRNKEGAEALVAKLEAGGRKGLAFQADAADGARAQAVVQEVIQAFGGLDILVNNAGANQDAVIWKMTEQAWDEVMATDLKGVFNYIRAVAPHFRERKGGKIVTVSSINGMRGKFGQSNYAAAKAGVIGLSKSVAKELGRSSVNVNVVCPGIIGTDMVKSMPQEALQTSIAEVVLGRLGTPEEVAEVIAFLASERARHITGEVIKVDGGQYI